MARCSLLNFEDQNKNLATVDKNFRFYNHNLTSRWNE